MMAATALPDVSVVRCSSCCVGIHDPPWCLCANAMHWRTYCEGLVTERDRALHDRKRLLHALRWTSTATAFLRGGSLRREWVRRVKGLLEKAKREQW